MNYKQKIEKIIGPLIKKTLLKEAAFPFHQDDWLFRGFTFEELITTVESNESTINEQTITKVFNEIMKNALLDAKSELREKMPLILKELNRVRK